MEPDKKKALKILKDRLALISRGICIEPISEDKPVVHLQSHYGGTGPRGKKYYVCYDEAETPERMISLPIYPESHYLSKYAVKTKRSERNSHDLITENGIILKGVPASGKNKVISQGIPIAVIVENHPYETKTINVSSSCRHFENEEKCKFCTTDVGMQTMNIPSKISHEEVMEALKLDIENNPNMRTITISGGTIESPENNLIYMVELAKRIKAVIDVTLFFQIEPCDDISKLKELAQNSEGLAVCLDVFDEKLRKDICPGKAKNSKEKYIRMWTEAVKFYGRGNVESHCIIGLGEDLDEVIKSVEECVSLGVKVTPLHVRVGSKDLGENFVPSYLEKEDEYLDFYIRVAQIMQKYGICYKHKDGSGCIGCNGCNAIVEACEYVSLLAED